MEQFFDWPRRFYLAAAIGVAGVLLAANGTRRQLQSRRLRATTMA